MFWQLLPAGIDGQDDEAVLLMLEGCEQRKTQFDIKTGERGRTSSRVKGLKTRVNMS